MTRKFSGVMFAVTAAFGLTALAMSPAQARNDVTMIDISALLHSSDAQSQLDPDVHFYFGSKKAPGAATTFGDVSSHGKARGDTDYESCSKAALEALVAMQKDAKKAGANAVVGVHSLFKRRENFSATQIECHSGSFSSVVELKGSMILSGRRP